MSRRARAARLALCGLAAALIGGSPVLALGCGGDESGGDAASQGAKSSGPTANPGSPCSAAAIAASGRPRWPACRPFASDSPFNTPLPADPQLSPESEANSDWLEQFDISSLVFGDSARDGGIPAYVSRPQDPLFTLHCTEPFGGRCEIEGKQVRIPAAARPAGVWPDPPFPTDGHLTVVDPRSGWEYDLWAVSTKPLGGGQLTFAWGGRTKIDGRGLGSAAVAARFASLAGPVRARELISGRIDHALAIGVPCTDGVVYPASGRSIPCDEAALPGVGAPPIGARFQLDLSEEEIDDLGIPEWQKTVLRALARYGGFVSDTTSQANWGVEMESGAAFRSFGEPDPRIAFARRFGATPEDFNGNGEQELWLYWSPEIDWSRMRVVDPCVTRGSC